MSFDVDLHTMPLTITEAIAREEGWLQFDSRSRKNHNPGNLEFNEWTIHHGAIAGDPRFAVFKSDADGFIALKNLLQQAYKGLTIAQAIAKFAPPHENDTHSYVRNICAWTELQSGMIIDNYIGEKNDTVTQA